MSNALRGNVIYLASPYTDKDVNKRTERYCEVLMLNSFMTQFGALVYSPIVSTHNLGLYGCREDWDYWKRLDMVMIEKCELFWVFCIPGWESSVGVQAEISIAEVLGREIKYIVEVEIPWPLSYEGDHSLPKPTGYKIGNTFNEASQGTQDLQDFLVTHCPR